MCLFSLLSTAHPKLLVLLLVNLYAVVEQVKVSVHMVLICSANFMPTDMICANRYWYINYILYGLHIQIQIYN